MVAVIPGGPADKAGIENSDIIESIEGKSTHDMSLAEIHSLLFGEVGSTVTVAVVRPRRAEPQKIVITRDMVTIPPVSDKMLADNVGYIKVDAFPEGKSQEIAGKIRDLQKQGAKKLVLDLRNCASGASLKAWPPPIFSLTMAPSLICKGRNIRVRRSTPIPPKTSPSFRWRCW